MCELRQGLSRNSLDLIGQFLAKKHFTNTKRLIKVEQAHD